MELMRWVGREGDRRESKSKRVKDKWVEVSSEVSYSLFYL